MSTFESYAWIDVADRAGVDAVLAVVDDERVWKAPQTLRAAFYDTGQGWRIAAFSRDQGHEYMPDFVAHLMTRTGAIVRAFVALDHDEYGAEHIVLGIKDGHVVRVHHRYIYPKFAGWPNRAGSPWQTDMPTIGPVRGSFTGRLVDSAEARSALADLFDVPLRRIRRAGRQALWSDSGLGVTYEPFTPWFEALGIDIAEPVGEETVLVRGRPVWREAFLRYALPNLPGRWHVLDNAALLTPVDLIACGVQRGIHAGLRVVLQPLYQRIDSSLFLSHPDEVGTHRWGHYQRVEDAEGYMRDAVATIRNDVLPMLETYGSLDGYRRFCAEQASDSDKPRSLYLLAATEIILERYDDASAALDEARARVQYQPDPWHPGPATPETRALLLARVAEQRRLLSLPGAY
ncbi:hypothetical protein [Paractinoplanes toevensis]|uniref:Uncharacterized protein n=1 Tax=Paractinoplanes toevensis TaxID=571911 RepID=A0A919WDF6_9ACTN|nr:hypothetical protein [Actinoplanes toevensis]GIM98225.1 hypothetical protein Ato02nite_100180 [Actinoplanes toevensis]